MTAAGKATGFPSAGPFEFRNAIVLVEKTKPGNISADQVFPAFATMAELFTIRCLCIRAYEHWMSYTIMGF